MSRPSEQAAEEHLRDVDRVLLYINEAQLKAEEMADRLRKAGAEERVIVALQTAARAMGAEHKRLMNSTFFTVPGGEQERIAGTTPDEAEQERLAV